MFLVLASSCPDCGMGRLRIRSRRADGRRFIGCSNYPGCGFTSDYNEEVEELVGDLQLSVATSKAELVSTLKELIFRFHPDRNHEPIDPTDLVSTLNAALAKLKQPD